MKLKYRKYTRNKKLTQIKIPHLQERDFKIFCILHDFRFCNSRQISALFKGDDQKIVRRLNLLYHAGWLDRIRSPFIINEPMIYGLTNKTYNLIFEKLGLEKKKTNYSSNNKKISPYSIPHYLDTSEFIIAIQLACKNKGYKFVSRHEIKNGLKKRKVKGVKFAPLSWTVNIEKELKERNKKITNTNTKINLTPDYIFAIEKNKKTYYFCLETDKGTMTQIPKNISRSSIYKKFMCYHVSFISEIFNKKLHFNEIRVLTITTSTQRLNNMIDVIKDIDERKKGLRLFNFSELSKISVQDPDKFFSAIWLTSRGEKRIKLFK